MLLLLIVMLVRNEFICDGSLIQNDCAPNFLFCDLSALIFIFFKFIYFYIMCIGISPVCMSV